MDFDYSYFILLGSGKSFTMFGNQSDNGILARSVAFILNTKPIYVSCLEIIGQEIFDLTDGKKEKMLQSGTSKKKMIMSTTVFDLLMAKILKLRSQKATMQNTTSSRSHLIVNIEDGTKNKLAFIDLAGWENPKLTENMAETIFINASLTSLNTALEKIAMKQVPSFDNILTKIFKPYLIGPARICMMYHVSNAQAKKALENIKNVAAKISSKENPKFPLKDITNEKRC